MPSYTPLVDAPRAGYFSKWMAARQAERAGLGWGRLGCCLLPVLAHCGGRSALSFEDTQRGVEAGASSGARAGSNAGSGTGARPGTGGSANRGGSSAVAGAGGAVTPGTGGFGTAGTLVAGFGSGAFGAGGLPTAGVGAGGGSAGAGNDCPAPCENGRSCAKAGGRAFCDCGPGLFGDRCEIRTESIAIGDGHACLLRSDGQVACWGKDTDGAATSPAGSDFTAIDAHAHRSCGIRSGRLDCWGEALRPSPRGTLGTLALGNDSVCGVVESGRVQCFIANGSYAPDVADVKQLVAGDDFACALHPNGTVSCWGGYGPVSDLPSDEFLALAAGSTFVCGLTSAQHVACWGDPLLPATTPPWIEAKGIAAGRAHACAIGWDYSLLCWGDNEYGQASPPAGQFVSVFAGGNLSCAIDADGRVHCWGGDENVGPAPGGHFIAVSAGYGYACAIAIDGSVSCFGNREAAAVAAPAGSFTSLEARRQACGIQRNGELDCWGNDLEEPEPPNGKFVAVSTGAYDSCAVRESGELACWGQDFIGAPPAGAYSHVSVGVTHACAIARDDQKGVCWDKERFGPLPEELGDATAITSGDGHSCTLDQKGYPLCWGTFTSVLPRRFSMISAGNAYTTGVTLEGELLAWGNDLTLEPPPGTDFTSVSSWSRFGCALRRDGTLTCWGDLKR